MPTQVLIEVTIAEVTLNDQLKFGVRWFLQNNGSSVTFTDAISGSVKSVFPGFSYALALTNVTAAINTLNQITDVNVISSPSLTVMDHKTAVLQIGDEVPITTGTAVSTIAAGAPIVSSVSYKDTGVILAMTPRINASGRILLDLEQEVSTVVPTTSSGIDSPTIRQRRIRTSVVVNNGEALALGGLIQNNQTLARTQNSDRRRHPADRQRVQGQGQPAQQDRADHRHHAAPDAQPERGAHGDRRFPARARDLFAAAAAAVAQCSARRAAHVRMNRGPSHVR